MRAPKHDNTVHVFVWDPQRCRWLKVSDIQFRRFAVKIARLEYDIENGFDKCEGSGDVLQRLPIDRARTALVNLHNILVNAMRKWEQICKL